MQCNEDLESCTDAVDVNMSLVCTVVAAATTSQIDRDQKMAE